MEVAVPSPTSARSRLTGWIGRHPGSLLLLVAALLGLVVLPALASPMKSHDVLINNQISLTDAVWLVVALALGVVCLVARSSLGRDLGEGLRQLIAAWQPAEAVSRRTGSGAVDTPALGVAIVRGIFDLIVLLIIQGIIRTPLVGVVSAYQPKPLVDGIFVVVVVAVALLMLFGLHRVSQPLTEYLVTLGLDHLVPTAGFAAADLPETAPTRTMTRTPSATASSRGTGQPSVATGARSVPAADQPTVAAAATIATPAEATVAALGPMESAVEATIAAPPATGERTVLESAEVTLLEGQSPPGAADVTVAEEQHALPTPPPAPVGGTGETIVEQKVAGDATLVEAPRQNAPEARSSGDADGATR